MSFGYVPAFETKPAADFGALEPWLQEELLDEVERLLESVPAPTVAQRLESTVTVHELIRHDGAVEHRVIFRTRLEVESRRLVIDRVGHVTRPL